MLAYATLLRNLRSGRNAVCSTVLHNGLRANGQNVQLHADKMEQGNVKFTAQKLVLAGNISGAFYFMTLTINISHSAVTIVEDDICLELAGNKPATVASCNEGKVCPQWFTSKWQPCNKLCGEGKQTRQVVCYRKEEDGRITVLDEKDCQDEKPEEETTCMIHPCEGVEYIASTWSGVRIF